MNNTAIEEKTPEPLKDTHDYWCSYCDMVTHKAGVPYCMRCSQMFQAIAEKLGIDISIVIATINMYHGKILTYS